MEIVNKNPHVLQNSKSKYTDDFHRMLDMYTKQERFEKSEISSTVLYYGQLKLLISEIEFLTLCMRDLESTKNVIVLYIGSASGEHISMVINMFPLFEYVLIDPRGFKLGQYNKSKTNVRTINKLFDNNFCKSIKSEYKDKTILYISDIRTITLNGRSVDVQDYIGRDMISQKEWFYILNPFRSLLKFRFPYCPVQWKPADEKPFKYLDGSIFIQSYEPPQSTETRLYVKDNPKEILYYPCSYADRLSYFNKYIRTLCYSHKIKSAGIDHCYDCYSYIYILENYIRQMDLKTTVVELMAEINENLNTDKKIVEFKFNDRCYRIKYSDYKYGVTDEKLYEEEISCNKTRKLKDEDDDS